MYCVCCCRAIEIFQAPHLLLVCTILVHKKLINCLRWHPQFTAESELSVSPCRLWLASASNESVVHVYNLEKTLMNGDMIYVDICFIFILSFMFCVQKFVCELEFINVRFYQ